MALLLKGNELLATGPLSAEVLARLVQIAARRPLVINGITLHTEDIERLIEEARRTGQPVPLGTHEPTALPLKPLHYDYSSIPQIKNARPEFAFRTAASGETGLGDETARPRTYHDKVLDHATERLARLTHLTEPDEVSRQFRTFLKLEDERLRIAHRLGSHGRWTAHARSFVFDVLITHAWRIATGTTNVTGDGTAAGHHKCSIVAIDGYGRGELAPFSVLDILFLHANRRSIEGLETIERVLHLLWDAGVTIEHRVRTVSECMAGARADPHFQTRLMNMRLVAGNESYFQRLAAAFERAIRERPRAVIEDLRHEFDLRRRKYGASTCLQEPSVKEGAGGLRDFHAGLWAAYAAHECRTLEALSARRLITPERRARVEEAYDFLLRVRHESHWTMKRKADRIALDVQPTLAGNLGYRSSSHLRASEQFMRDYYRAARDLHLFGELLLSETFSGDERRRDEDDTSSNSSRSNRRRRRFDRPRPVDETAEETAAATHANEVFSITNGRLHLEADASEMAKNPSLFFRAFALAQASGVPLSRGLHEAITRSLSAVDHSFRESPANAGEFLVLLRRRGRVGRVLRLMHETGFLARYVPEFGRISLLIQHDNYHHYTIDEHTLRAVEALDEVDHDCTSPAIQRLWTVFEEIDDIALVYLATLLHDLGKGRGSGHVVRGVKIAGRVCRRMGLDNASAAKVIALVNHHILISHVSQRRDLSEPRVVREFAERIGDLDVLNMLLLLSYADLKGVGPGAWTEWKGSLLYELYRRARSHLTGGETAHAPLDDRQVLAAEVHALLDGRASRSEVERHFTLLPDGYTRTVSAKAAAAHLAMIDRLRRGNRRVVCQWSPDHNTATALTIAAHDRRGLFAGIAGALAAQGIEILSADLNTRADAIVVDYLLLREAATHEAVAEHRWPNLERALEGAVSGAVDVGELIERWRKQNAPRRAAAVTTAAAAAARHPQISFDNEIAEAMTIVEVRAADEPGLAYKIANAISSCNLNIARARVATEKSDAFDVFYVTTAENLKLSTAEMTRLREALLRT